MFIIVYDDGNCLCIPMKFDADCDGAVCCMDTDAADTVALFDSRASARKAIRISTKLALLNKEQGKPVNDDFLVGKKYLKILPLGYLS